jgi:hypothetical protein
VISIRETPKTGVTEVVVTATRVTTEIVLGVACQECLVVLVAQSVVSLEDSLNKFIFTTSKTAPDDGAVFNSHLLKNLQVWSD